MQTDMVLDQHKSTTILLLLIHFPQIVFRPSSLRPPLHDLPPSGPLRAGGAITTLTLLLEGVRALKGMTPENDSEYEALVLTGIEAVRAISIISSQIGRRNNREACHDLTTLSTRRN